MPIPDELRRRANGQFADSECPLLYRLAARALQNGGGCKCSVPVCNINSLVPYKVVHDPHCHICAGTGYDPESRELLAALGLEVK